MRVLMILLYLWAGDVKLDQEAYRNEAECQIAAAKRVAEIQKDPRFEGGFGAWCIQLPEKKKQS